ncbi:hypothetical protein ADEAN_000388100 [Angomonas deanei]|uniref:Uncharacterized protein n=1 Tax=Angomonas deanei TaxID=59799 RepID=A0A7G2CA36_9TRYP|nr:hypothetical protein ADEAN_000388100 [Angomonas deanei]
MNRELLEAQLSDLSTVADEQMGLLQDKGTQLSDLRRVASLKDSELAALRVKCDSLMSSLRETCDFDKKINTLKSAHQEEVAHLREDLEQTRHMRDLQAEMVAVLEEQLTRLSKTLNEVHSGSRGQSTIGGSPIAGERSGNDISGFERHLQHLISEDDCPPEEFSEQFSRGNRPSPAKRDTSTMMRNAENVKLYKPFDWKDVNDTQ